MVTVKMKWMPQNRHGIFGLMVIIRLSVIFVIGCLIMVWYAYNDYTDFRKPVPRRLANDKPSVLLFIGIISAPQLIFRRNALRRSWLRQCKIQDVACWIFTDGQDIHGKRLPEHIYRPLKQEQYLHNDLILTETPGGINFIQWANERYRFDFLLRVDDDYFICMDRLLLELPHRPKEKLYWGHVHCHPPGGIRVDEGFVIVSNDLVQHFLREQNNTLMCHPYGDQAMAMWINDIPGVTYFGDPRVHHDVSADDNILQYYVQLCGTFLALHGSYPVEIEKFWLNHLSSPRIKEYEIPGISYPCGEQNKTYDKKYFLGMYYAEPILCKKLPRWNISEFYIGRSG